MESWTPNVTVQAHIHRYGHICEYLHPHAWIWLAWIPKKNIFPCSTYPSPGVYVQCAYLLHVYAGTRTQAYADMQTCLQYTNCSRPDSMLSLHPFVGLDILDHETCSFATILLGPTDVNQLALRCFLQSWSDVQIQKIVFDRFGPIRNSDLAHLGRSLQVLLCSRCTWRVSGSFVSTEYVACLPGWYKGGRLGMRLDEFGYGDLMRFNGIQWETKLSQHG
jgi:hypothetical protein